MRMQGVIVPLITPLTEDEEVDEPALEKLVEYVIGSGVSGIFVLGSAGEGPALTDAVKERLVRCVSEQAKGRVPVLVGVFAVGTRQSIALAERLTRQGGDAILLTAPFYFAQTQDEVVTHIRAVACSQHLPALVYNIPQTVKTVIEPETVERLAETPGIVGIKDSYGDMARFQRLLLIRQQHPGFMVFQGAEAVAAISVLRGADGGVWGLANVAPRLFVELCAAARAGDLQRAWALQERLLRLSHLYSHGQWLSCLKTAVSQLDLCSPRASAPFAPLGTAASAAIHADLVAGGILAPG